MGKWEYMGGVQEWEEIEAIVGIWVLCSNIHVLCAFIFRLATVHSL